MYEDTLRRHLDEIIENLDFDDYDLKKKYKNYKLEISDKHLSSRNGCYFARTMTIQITRSSEEKNANNVKTTLHELAHHLDYINRGRTGHGKEFYEQYRKLIYSALDLNKITLTEMMEMTYNSTDYKKVMKILQEYERKPPRIELDEELIYEINVPGLGRKDSRMATHGYTYNQRRKTWFRQVGADTLNFEKRFLESLGISEFDIRDANTINMLDDEWEFLNNEKEKEARKKELTAKIRSEYSSMKGYIERMVQNGHGFDYIHTILSGSPVSKDDDGNETFEFNYITLCGRLTHKGDEIELSDTIDVFEFMKTKKAKLLFTQVNINNIEEIIKDLR